RTAMAAPIPFFAPLAGRRSVAVGARQELDRMGDQLRRRPVGAELVDPLRDMRAGERTFGYHVTLAGRLRLTRDRPADLQRGLEIRRLAAPGAAVAGAALDHRDIRFREKTQQIGALLADVLSARMTGHVERDAAL